MIWPRKQEESQERFNSHFANAWGLHNSHEATLPKRKVIANNLPLLAE